MFKKSLVLAAVLVFSAGMASAQWTSIVDSAHDLSAGSTAYTATTGQTNINQVCVFCHTPHSASIDVPLWNHNITDGGSHTYTMYSSSTMNATNDLSYGGSTITNMCLSCHDGTIAVTNIVNTPDTVTAGMNNGGTVFQATGELTTTTEGYLGLDLSNDHPVSIGYAEGGETVSDGGLKSVSDATTAGVRLFGDSGSEHVECASCHDVHDADPTKKYFLRVNNDDSDLCLACHNK
jgi:predicted CXXCH cytochrome family protein